MIMMARANNLFKFITRPVPALPHWASANQSPALSLLTNGRPALDPFDKLPRDRQSGLFVSLDSLERQVERWPITESNLQNSLLDDY